MATPRSSEATARADSHRLPPWRRLAAAALDLAVVAGWAAFAAVVGMVLRSYEVTLSATGWDVVAFVTLVLPVTLTFALQEASQNRATFGKRRLGLEVVDSRGRRLGFGRSALRSGIKFLPWQMAHTSVFQLLESPTAGFLVLSVAAQVLALGSVVALFVDRRQRALHDWLARTQVLATDREEVAGR